MFVYIYIERERDRCEASSLQHGLVPYSAIGGVDYNYTKYNFRNTLELLSNTHVARGTNFNVV